jgi:hypothetical protein
MRGYPLIRPSTPRAEGAVDEKKGDLDVETALPRATRLEDDPTRAAATDAKARFDDRAQARSDDRQAGTESFETGPESQAVVFVEVEGWRMGLEPTTTGTTTRGSTN